MTPRTSLTPELTTLVEALSTVNREAEEAYQNQSSYGGEWLSREDMLSHYMEATFGNSFTYLASGIARSVYTHEEHPGVVFKLVRRSDVGSNEKEYEVFRQADSKQRRKMAKCFALSAGKDVLLMERIMGPRAYDRMYTLYGCNYQNPMRRLAHRFNQEFGQHDFHGANIMYCDRRRRYIAVDYADD